MGTLCFPFCFPENLVEPKARARGEARGVRAAWWRRRWRERRRSRSGGERVTASKTPVRAVRSPFRLTCLRTAPTGGEEGGEPAGAVCARSPRAGGVRAVAARWWATAHRAERGASEEHTGQCAVRDSQIAKSNKKNRSSSCESSSTTNPAVVGISAPGAAGRAALRKAAGLPLASSRPAAP